MKLLNDKNFKDVFFSTKGRLGIGESWTYSLGLSVVGIIIGFICNFLIREIRGGYNDFGNYSAIQNIIGYSLEVIQILIFILLIIMDIFVKIKRAHDLGKKGSRLRCLLIPIYNIIVGIELAFYMGQKEDNEYGKYNGENLPKVAYIIRIIEFIIIFGWNLFGDKIESLYEDKPLTQFNERVSENENIENLIIWNDDFYEESQKIIKDIVDTKLNCDCFGDNATEKPTMKVDETFWNSVYEELEPKLLELAKDPKYNIEE